MILREHLLTIDLMTGDLKTVRAGYYGYVMHEIPDMLEWWHTLIGCDDMILVQYHARACMFVIFFDGYNIRMVADVK